jgi:ankyrin repeat protein
MRTTKGLIMILGCASLFVSLSSQNATGQKRTSNDYGCQGRTKQEQAFLNAIANKQIETVKRMLEKGVSANTKDDCEYTGLMKAAKNNDTELVNLLLQAGAEVNIKRRSIETALVWAFDDDDDKGESHRDDNYLLVKSLIDAGADVNVRTYFPEETVTMLAAKSNRIKSLELLLAAGAPVQARDIHDKTALAYATERGYVEAKVLLKKYGANAREAVEGYKTEFGDGAFIQATAQGRADVVEAMLEEGMDANSGNAARVTALMRVQNIHILKILLDAGANIHARDNAGFTPLIHIAATRNAEIVKVLIKAGADIEAKTNDGKNALMFAALAGDADTVQALLEAGAKAGEKDDAGNTALKFAVARNNIKAAKLLRQAQ